MVQNQFAMMIQKTEDDIHKDSKSSVDLAEEFLLDQERKADTRNKMKRQQLGKFAGVDLGHPLNIVDDIIKRDIENQSIQKSYLLNGTNASPGLNRGKVDVLKYKSEQQ